MDCGTFAFIGQILVIASSELRTISSSPLESHSDLRGNHNQRSNYSSRVDFNTMWSAASLLLTLSMPLSVMGFLPGLAAAHPKLVGFHGASSQLFASDTPEVLPEFADRKEYMEYMETVSSLPEGFAVGTAKGVRLDLNGKKTTTALTPYSFSDLCVRRSPPSGKPSD